MLLLQIAQQSLIGSIFSPFIRILRFIGSLLLKILLLPYYLVKYLVLGTLKIISWLLPDFYEENLIHSFKGLFCIFRFAFLIFTFLLLVLLPLHFLPLLGSHGILASKFLYQFDLIQALVLMVKTFTITEILIIAFAIGGFLVSFLLAFVFITTYSPLQVLVEFIGELTKKRLVLILMFILALVIFSVLYFYLLRGEIPFLGKIPL